MRVKGEPVDCMINPVTRISRIPGGISCTEKKADRTLSHPKIDGCSFKGAEADRDVFVKSQEKESSRVNSSETFGDKFIKAAKETVEEIEAKGIPISKASSLEVSTGIIDKLHQYGAFGPKKIDYVT